MSDFFIGLRFLLALKRYIQEPLSLAEAEEQIRRQIRRRTEAFLHVVRYGIFAHEPSPYRQLMRYYGIEYEDVAALAEERGVEVALEALYNAGIYITLDQFKGRAPIERPGFYLETSAADFDSPILGAHFMAQSGGSGGAPRRMRVDLDTLAYEGGYSLISAERLGREREPYAIWHPIPPGGGGFKDVLRRAKGGLGVTRWFSQVDPRPWCSKMAAFTWVVVHAMNLWGSRIAMPEHLPMERAEVIARWLNDQKAQGRPGCVSTTVSGAVRICAAAKESALDISGSLFRVGGEPYSEAKAQIIESLGARGVPYYAMSEVGRIGMACGQADVVDEVHLCSDKLAVIQKPPASAKDPTIGAFYLTTLLPGLPKLMLNVETGDYGVIQERPCGCPWEALGMTTHIHSIRSYEKLTTEGMHFTGADLLRLIEQMLPQRFGGTPADYQMVEEEVEGLTRVSLFVSPRLGEIDEQAVAQAAMETLGARNSGTRMMAEIWQQADTLRIVRQEPYVTSSAKIQPLHVRRRSQGGSKPL